MGSTERFISGFGCIVTKMLAIRPCWTLPEGKLRMHMETWPKMVTVSWSARPHAAALSSCTFHSGAIGTTAVRTFRLRVTFHRFRRHHAALGLVQASRECGEKRKTLFSNKWLEMRWGGKREFPVDWVYFRSSVWGTYKSPLGAHVGSEGATGDEASTHGERKQPFLK